MERRTGKYNRQVSPERAKVWTQKSPKYRYHHHHHQNQKQQQQQQQKSPPHPPPEQESRRVPVVYYLCRNRQLEHPHFIQVPLSSPDGLYLSDVIERLNGLRGRGMASMYSWSCKRSYKNGFVWHDICEDDLIAPAHGNEYVLKGSELVNESNSGRFSPVENTLMQNPKLLPEPPSARSQDESSSSSSLNGKTPKYSQDDEFSPPVERPGSSAVSPVSSAGKNTSTNGSLSLTEYKVYKGDGFADASTQTEEIANGSSGNPETCTKGVSTDDRPSTSENKETHQNRMPRPKVALDACSDAISPPPSSSSASSGGRTDTLESLIRADVRKLNSFRILAEEEFRMPTSSRLKASNMIMQLISCGSVAVKDHSFGFIPAYPRFSHSKYSSPLYSTQMTFGELDCLAENPRFVGLRLEDKEYFSGSLIETNKLKEGAPAALKRSSSFNADRTSNQLDSVEDNEDMNSRRSKCIPRSIKVSLSKQPRSESMRSPLSEGPRISNDRVDSSRIASGGSNGGSKRITEPSSGKHSKRVDSFRDEKENVIKIEERLASGARVIIHSEASPDNEEHP